MARESRGESWHDIQRVGKASPFTGRFGQAGKARTEEREGIFQCKMRVDILPQLALTSHSTMDRNKGLARRIVK